MKKLLLTILMIGVLGIGFCQNNALTSANNAKGLAVNPSALAANASDNANRTIGTNAIIINSSAINADITGNVPVSISDADVNINKTRLTNENGEDIKQISVSVNSSKGQTTLNIERVQSQLQFSEENNGVNVTLQNSMELILQNGKVYANMTLNGTGKEITVMPSQAISAVNATNQSVWNMTLISENNEFKYEIQEEKMVRLFGLFSVNMSVSSRVNAETGSVEAVNKPWWSFLTVEEE